MDNVSKGLLTGVGMGATFAGAALIPLPVLLLGGVLYLSSRANQEAAPEPEPLSQEEQDELFAYMEIIERAPNPEAAQALIEEFYV